MGMRWKRQRLKGWDYSRNGLYFVTVCASSRRELFGSVVREEDRVVVRPSFLGDACIKGILHLQDSCVALSFDKATLMPDHLHLLVCLTSDSGTADVSLSEAIAKLKRMVTREAKRAGMDQGIWQRSFYDHIVRNEREAALIREYMENNPSAWALGKHDIQEEVNATAWQGNALRSAGISVAATEAPHDLQPENALRPAGISAATEEAPYDLQPW